MEMLISVIRQRCVAVDRAVVAMSGGVDSTLVAAAAAAAMGVRCVAVTVQSELTAPRDFTRAVEMAEHIGIEHHPLCIRLREIKEVRRNTELRCYHCKRAIFDLMRLEYGDDTLIMDGTNKDDDPKRPGLKTAKEFGVFSPLKEAGMTKADVRRVAKSIELPNWDTPSESCLATRIPTGIPLNQQRLEMVRAMEEFFHARGVKTLRARHDNLVATIEVLSQYNAIIEKNHDRFMELISDLGLRSYRVCVLKG
ncbi:ATP-dependent sacrificial sulfur transferase LarE [Pseudodesulfovibrio sp. zrk46]|uniref:ATP-dependent sacrificial sulfur transferase LarE n=1 Tax=Pseudodesulfovibrio sp. zrk46 TaxID=2725288 RepID=UPI00144A2543|nr:ATP-dependent sacrificial sulfur transferase LarE [Pseudodesulfovibrio sp. zrk46]QJB56019.1 ATP-dependent sacrificial sulfur transferase LarE [Pseudodesulfovibrio sp. zrk46]